MPRNAITPLSQPVFNEGSVTPDPTGFKVEHASDTQVYKEIQNLLTKDVVSFNPMRGQPGTLYTLEDAYGSQGSQLVSAIKKTGKIIFHSAGDSGASNQGKYGNELRVCDQLTADCRTADPANRPAFLYHLGDVVYDFGESRYYYDQFYDPFRDYPGPIFAIPGNHDSFIVPNTPAAEDPLTIFSRNFCSQSLVLTPEAASLHRTAMTQPGVYFTLDAPFVRIIGLFSNSLEDPGVISSENGKWSTVPDLQLAYLEAQLKQAKKYTGALILAVHHPPFSYSPPRNGQGAGGDHGGSPNMLRQIDTICKAQGVYPHVMLSGHAHNYQRFTRALNFGGKDYQVPFIICGDSGHNVNPLVKGKRGEPAQEPEFGADVSYLDPNQKSGVATKGLTLNHYDDSNYGYLRVTVDKSRIQLGFHQVGAKLPQSRVDFVTVDLATHKVVAN